MNRDNVLIKMELFKTFMQLKNNLLDMMTPVTHEYGLTLMESLVLFSVSESNDLSIGDVYKSMNLNQGNLSSMCKKLEEKGYLIRNRDKRDQRAVILEITEKGEETLDNINDELYKLYKIVEEIPSVNIEKAVDGLTYFAEVIGEIHSKIEN